MKKFHLSLKAMFFSCLLFAGANLQGQQDVTFTGGAITQPDLSGRGAPYPSTIDVSGIGAGFLEVTVTLSGLTHTRPDDLNILLVSPTGAQCVLMSDVGGNDMIADVEYIFADGGPLMDNSNFNPSGTYSPTNSGPVDSWPSPGPGSVDQGNPVLSIFDGASADGTWSLYYNDDADGDSGSMDSWSITFTVPSTVDNDDCLDAELIACGETLSGSTADALPDDVRRCGPGTGGPGVWYAFEPESGDFIQSLSTCNADNADIRISIYYGHCDRLRCLGSSDDSDDCGNDTTAVRFTPFFGRPHYVLVQASDPAGKVDFDLTYNCDASSFRQRGGAAFAGEVAEALSLYPNPVRDELNVSLQGFAGRQAAMRIHNSLGQVVMQRNISQLGEQSERFNTSLLGAGMYFLNVQVEGGATFTEKFVVGSSGR